MDMFIHDKIQLHNKSNKIDEPTGPAQPTINRRTKMASGQPPYPCSMHEYPIIHNERNVPGYLAEDGAAMVGAQLGCGGVSWLDRRHFHHGCRHCLNNA